MALYPLSLTGASVVPNTTHPLTAGASDHRIVDPFTCRAERIAKGYYSTPKPNNLAAKNGLRYERKVGRELERHVVAKRFLRLEHNPWFKYVDRFGAGQCSPDFLLWVADDHAVIVEVKLTWVEVAKVKFIDLYAPVTGAALRTHVSPLIICRNLTPASPPPAHTLRDALLSDDCLLHWPEVGHVLW